MSDPKIVNDTLRMLKELSLNLGVPPEKFFAELTSLMDHYSGLRPDTLILDISGTAVEEKAQRKEYHPAYAAVVNLPDLDVDEAQKLSEKLGRTVWGLPLLHLHTEYVARALISSIVNGGESGRVFIPSAIITLAAALEAAIGEATFIKCRALLGQDHYSGPAEAICKLGPLNRLEVLVPFASKGEFTLRRSGSKPAELIRALFPLRNNLMHQNLEYLRFKVVEATDSAAPYRLEFPPAFEKHLARIDLDNDQLQAYWSAYLGLKDSFLRTKTYREDEYLCKVVT